MRFVTVSPTGVGVVTCVRRAAAAAAEERSPLDSAFLMKAFEAAREAEALVGGARWGCMEKNCQHTSRHSKHAWAARQEVCARALADSTYRVRGCPSSLAKHDG